MVYYSKLFYYDCVFLKYEISKVKRRLFSKNFNQLLRKELAKKFEYDISVRNI